MFLYQELDDYDGVYFTKNGPIGYVHPQLNNLVYFRMESGTIHGFEDLIYNQQKHSAHRDQPLTIKEMAAFMRRGRLGKRRFAVMNLVQGEVLLLRRDDLQRMISDFPVPFKKLFHLSVQHLSKLISRNISSVVKHKSFPVQEFAKGSNDVS